MTIEEWQFQDEQFFIVTLGFLLWGFARNVETHFELKMIQKEPREHLLALALFRDLLLLLFH